MQAPALEEVALFHAQQGAEKALKAYLIIAGADDIPRTHRLRSLTGLLNQLGAPAPSQAATAFLDGYGVGTRYPDTPRPDAETVRTAMEYARNLVGFVQAQMESIEHSHD